MRGNALLVKVLVFVGTLVSAAEVRNDYGAGAGALTFVGLWIAVAAILLLDRRQKQHLRHDHERPPA